MGPLKWVMRAEADEGEGAAPEPVADDGDSKLWDDLLEDESVETEVEEVAETATAEEVGSEAEPEAVVVEEKAPAPKVEETPIVEKPAEAEAQPAAPVVSQPPPQPAQPEAVSQPWQITDEQRQQWRQQALSGLAHRYALAEEDASALQVEPEKVLPKIAANLHMQVFEDVLRHIAQEAPALVERSLQQRDSTRQAEEAFYARWQALRQHSDKVNRVAQMWRQMYPNATLEEAIEGVGQAASALLGMAPAVEAPAQPPVPPPAPARPAARGPMRPQVQSKLSAEEQAFADLANEFTEDF